MAAREWQSGHKGWAVVHAGEILGGQAGMGVGFVELYGRAARFRAQQEVQLDNQRRKQGLPPVRYPF
jgi:hypothetical protein